MKKIIATLSIAFFTISSFAQMGSVSDKEFKELVGGTVKVYMKSHHADMFEGGNPQVMFKKAVAVLGAAEDEYLCVQILMKNGKKSITEMVFFYPDDAGLLNEANYTFLDKGDWPSQTADLVSIDSSNTDEPIATFKNRSSGEKITKKLGYNLREMTLYWF
jgi:hypothetical protein